MSTDETGGWNDEKIGRLKKLWSEGLTTGEIGKRLGVSKNAVVGKAHRLGLQTRKQEPRTSPQRFIRRGLAPKVDLPDPLKPRTEDPVCTFLSGKEKPWVRCTAPARPGSSYCPEHHAVVWITKCKPS